MGLLRLRLGELNSADMAWLDAAASCVYTGDDAEAVLRLAAAGRMQLWRAGDGIIVTQILSHRAGKELLVWSLAGKKMAFGIREYWKGLQDYAEEQDCRWIGWQTKIPRLVKVLQRMGMEPDRVGFLVEV